jgi:dihydrofolate reductase
MTRVLAEVEGDTYFPAVDWPCWQLKSSEPCPATPRDEYTTRFEVWDRIEPPVN